MADESALIAVLRDAKASDFDKAKACQQLAVTGTKAAVPSLAALLTDERFSHYARFGLEPIAHPSVDKALRDALGRTRGKLRAGVVNSIGRRRDQDAVKAVAKLLGDSDAVVAQAAAGALGDIGGPRAGKALLAAIGKPRAELRGALAAAGLACAEELASAGRKPEALALYAALKAGDYSKAVKAAAVRGAAIANGRLILVYTRNYTPDGKGYVHDNIQTSVEAIRKMGDEAGFAVDWSDDARVFKLENLRKYKALVFSNSNNEAFEDDAQREVFQAYLKSGRGYVGIHSATGSERKWPYYWSVAGGKFLRHPKIQPFTVRVKNAAHPATKGLPADFVWSDECYYHTDMNPSINVLLVTDPAKLDDPRKAEYPGDRFGDALPLAWYNNVDGGRAFYTALGHKKEHYSDPLFVKHVLGGILWAMGDAEVTK